MKLDWSAVRARYERTKTLQPLAGQSTLEVVEVDDEKICVKQRLWRDCVTRTALETALTLLEDRPLPGNAVEFAEELRRYYSRGPAVTTGCSRVPNLSAVVLSDLGYLEP
jgi:hypothetical protein